MEITGRLKRAAAVMISAAMIIGMCGNALAEETDSSRGRETIAAEGINERNEGGMAGEGTGGMEAGAAGDNGAGDSTTESAVTEAGAEERRIPIIRTMVPREVEACGWASMRF